MGFDKPANPNAKGTLEEAIGQIKALPVKPAFMIHTGDITHLSKAAEFDDADKIISQAKLDVHYVPGEHDIIDDEIKLYKRTLRPRHQGRRLVQLRRQRRALHRPRQRRRTSRPAAWAASASEQLEWLEDDLKGRSASTPIVRVRAHPAVGGLSSNGAGAPRTAAARSILLKRFGSVTVLNGHIHQVMQKVEGNVAFHTARSTAFPQPAPGAAPSPGPMKVADDKLRSMLGIASVTFKRGDQRLAIIDTPLQG